MKEMGRRRVAALLLAVVAFGVAGIGSPTWFGALPLYVGRIAFFWLGVVCFLVAAWGRGGT